VRGLVALFLFWGYFAEYLYAVSTSTEISQSKKRLSEVSSDKEKTNIRLGKIANDIKSAEKEIVYIDSRLEKLKESASSTKKRYGVLKKELALFDRDLNTTTHHLDQKRERFIDLLSNQFSIAFAMNRSSEISQEVVLSYEVYKIYKEQNTQMLATIRKEIDTLKQSQQSKLTLRNRTQEEMRAIENKKSLFVKKKADKMKLLKKLEVYEEKYNAKLEKIVDRQNSLRATLAKLNILRDQEVQEAKKRAAAKKEAMRKEKQRQRQMREAKAKARRAKEALRRAKTESERKRAQIATQKAQEEEERIYRDSGTIKQVNSSYKRAKTYHYRGAKTFSPLVDAKVIKRFGTYIDPIYKMKIFNESITLQAPSYNAKVKNVLNGKVVFAGKSAMLGQVVVVAHSRKIHTVYAGLSKIAPNIHQGSKIKKGYIVGKVNRKLLFQVTKNSNHINPLELIRL
jgi:septal ring factor EnvC (AmiA/AmiB activator)